MGESLIRIVVERQGAEGLPQTRAELLQLGQAQRGVTQATEQGRATLLGWGPQVQRAGQVSEFSARRIGLLRTGMTMLAFQATNTVGPLGRVAAGLLLFAGGSTLVLGVAAGVAAIAGGFRLLTRATREAEARVTALRERITELREHADPTLAVRAEIERTTTLLVAAEARLSASRAQLEAMVAERVALAATLGVTLAPQQARFGLLREQRMPSQLLPSAREVQALRELLDVLRRDLSKTAAESGRDAARAWLEGLRAEIAGGASAERLQAILADLWRRIAAGGERELRRLRPVFLEAFEELQRGAPRFLAGPPLVPRLPFGLFRAPTEAIERPRIGRFPLGAFGAEPQGPILFPDVSPFRPGRGRDVGAAFRHAAITQDLARREEELSRLREVAAEILGRLQTPQQIYNDAVTELERAFQAGALSAEQLAQGMKLLKEDMDKASQASPALAASIIGAVSGTIAALISGGGPGGLLAGLGGILGLVSQTVPGLVIPAALVSGLGTILLASESRQRSVRVDEYGARALDQLRNVGAGPELINISVVSPSTGEILRQVQYDLRRRERLDRIERLPPGTNL